MILLHLINATFSNQDSNSPSEINPRAQSLVLTCDKYFYQLKQKLLFYLTIGIKYEFMFCERTNKLKHLEIFSKEEIKCFNLCQSFKDKYSTIKRILSNIVEESFEVTESILKNIEELNLSIKINQEFNK